METLPHVYHGFGMRSKETPSGIVFPNQIHGNRVVVLDAPVPETWHETADALITSCPSLPIGVRTADCLPILIAERDGKGVAVIHAGWRGIALGILPETLRQMKGHLGVDCRDIYLAVGPGIGACCLEVDEPVKEYFYTHDKRALWEACTYPGRAGHWWLDMKMMAQRQAMEEGVKREHVDILPYCTSCESKYFYSYRREGLAAGRQVNYIVFTSREL